MHRKVSFSETPQATVLSCVFVLMCLVLIVTIAFSALRVSGVIDNGAKSYTEWQQTKQEIAAQTYDEYLDKVEHQNNIADATLLIIAPLAAVFFTWFLLVYFPSTLQKCPRGHVIGKGDSFAVASYCRVCGVKLYGQHELSPDEWKKRYGDV